MKFFDVIGLYEAQQELFEVEMSPSNLKKLAAAIPGVKVGMEFEMIVPGVQDPDDEDYEPEEDMDADERADDIADIVRFFGHEDDYMGQVNDPSDLRELEEELREKYYEWMSEKIDELWQEEGKDYFEKWVKENVDPDDVAEYVGKEPDLLGDTVPDEDDYETFINDQWDEGFGNKNYDRAYEEFREEYQDGYRFDENDFLRDIGIRDMSDVNDNIRMYIRWPYYTEPYREDGMDIESVADEFSDAIGKRVYSSTSYHGARRAPDAYSLEPDSSIDAGPGEAGLEFISPPQDVDQMLEDLRAVKEWADDKGAYTNRSTGLHINVSVPDYSLDKLDYVKLAILLGDKYVLDQFGRLSNTYAKSSLDIIKDRAKNSEDVDRLLKQLKGNVEGIASKILHSGRTDKYTSINTKDGYVEFRSAGGDWLTRNFNKIEDTMLRYIVALDAACDPEKYKKEYYKGLYKVLKPKDEKSEISMFAKYMSGEITRSEYANSLEQKRKERFRDQGIRILQKDEVEENDWEITYDDGKKSETIYIANTDKVPNDEAAFNAAKKFKPQWFKPDTIEYISVKPFKFGPELDDLKLYRAEFGHRYSSVVAKDEEEAKKYIRIMNPELFEQEPNREITLTDENGTKRQISQLVDWQENRLEQGRKYISQPKIWIARGRSNYSSRLYIAAVKRDEAIDVVKRLDPDMAESDNFDIYVTDGYPDQDTFDAYVKAQNDLIKVREAERELLRSQSAPEEVDISKLKVYRINNMHGYMYVVADDGAEACEIASRMEPAKFRDVSTLTAQEQSGSTFGSLVITNMYKYQQRKLSELPTEPDLDTMEFKTFYVSNTRGGGTIIVQARNKDEAYHVATREKPEWSIRDLVVTERGAPRPSSEINIPDELQPSSTRVSDMRSFRVQNVDTGESRYFAASDLQDAINRAREQYPAMFPQGAGLYATPHEPGRR